MYNVLLKFTQHGTHRSSWISYVHSLLLRNGFGFAWLIDVEQENVNVSKILMEFQTRIKLQFEQEWHSNINEISKCILYKHVKEEFALERYLCVLPWELCKYILKLRLCNHKLRIETGRYCHIERKDRICEICNLNQLGDEYHLFF